MELKKFGITASLDVHQLFNQLDDNFETSSQNKLLT